MRATERPESEETPPRQLLRSVMREEEVLNEVAQKGKWEITTQAKIDIYFRGPNMEGRGGREKTRNRGEGRKKKS